MHHPTPHQYAERITSHSALTSHTLITKADGEQEPFNPAKLEHSLALAGASTTMRARVLAHVMKELKPNMMTEEIYRHAFEILRREEAPPVAARYSIKRAVFALGPSGFPFEQFLAEVLRAHGWSVHTGVALTGRCAPHEVDVYAEKNGKRIGIEAKFHNDAGGKTDIKDALYVKARYDDLRNTPLQSSHVDEGWLVTNTRFTRNAIRYAQCSGLTLLGWDYPHGHGLFNLIEEARVHPLTCLTTLTESEKRRLLDQKIVLCKHVQAPHLLQEYGVKPDRIPHVLEEARQLCGI
ncbi:ATPase [Candidatus Kaiserbacteria bacterium CG10_big_fil_rev_8_21_14_0_10_51_14]|uniref:ATPase n=1 Tax=Candidatus Kaiserbacteria bacterium CG10_big_fil_rev_8_21_14_0_10_51_14 TaxID=1974610 RepID=A0A2H0UAY3_9BACT|nr:MAG: ATPase [Candidatus Kaiserbacteria bacterium CG10_big_fil_rev_8_21_14_0_10_51_14]